MVAINAHRSSPFQYGSMVAFVHSKLLNFPPNHYQARFSLANDPLSIFAVVKRLFLYLAHHSSIHVRCMSGFNAKVERSAVIDQPSILCYCVIV
jgi:hypothetical protein